MWTTSCLRRLKQVSSCERLTCGVCVCGTCRDRVQLLLAALGLLYEKLGSSGGDPGRCRVIQGAISQVKKTFQAALGEASHQEQPVDHEQVCVGPR